MTSMVCLWRPRQMAQTGRMMRVLEDDIPVKLFGCASFRKVLDLFGYTASVCSLVGGESGRLEKLGVRECCGLYAPPGVTGLGGCGA